MRDILVTLLVFGSLPFILRNAYVGVLVWSWLSYMNPHRLAWGFAYSMPFAQIVAITLFVALLVDRDKKIFPINGLTCIWFVYLAWMAVTTSFAFFSDSAVEQLIKIYKVQIITFLTVLLINSQKKIDLLIWVIVLSIGYFSVKGGVFTIITGGGSKVWGPPGGFIQENNSLAVAILMIIPLIVYLRQITEKAWVRHGLFLALILSLVSAIGSQSRGALIAIVAVGVFFWLKTKGKIISGVLIIVLASVGWNFMPQSWHERMGTIQHYQEDSSAMGRINAWKYAINVANDRLTGAGLESWSGQTFAIYAPNPTDVHSAHSIYFSVLADHGWPGLVMFLLILFLGWRYLSQVIRFSKDAPEHQASNFLARMLQISMIAYMSGGAFLSLAYFDLPWHFLALAVLLKYLVVDKQQDNLYENDQHTINNSG